MRGIEAIAVYLPEQRASNRDLMEKFEVDASFLEDKIGVVQRAVRGEGEDTSDMALKALQKLLADTGTAPADVQALIVVTQNPDTNLPHVSGVVHARAGLAPHCAAFDISLGCSGFVYGLSVMQSLLEANGLTRGVLVTCDPYSKIIDPEDKNTVLLFGDAATATLVGPKPVLRTDTFEFGTRGDVTGALICRDGKLEMNGRDVFNFAATVVPKNVEKLLDKAQVGKEAVDRFLFHQGSAYIVETLRKRLGLPAEKVPLGIRDIGNTVSSSIPILLQRELADPAARTFVLCGFGVGLSWASCLSTRTEN
jgi:3-oxoacyl-[acyl-carrier-protein] synthase-3